MKQRGAVGILVLSESVILIVAIILSTVRALGGSGEKNPGIVIATESFNQIEVSSEPLVEDETVADAAGDEPEVFSEEVKQKLSSMTLEEKVAQMFFTSPEELTGNELVNVAGARTKDAITTYPVGGLVYTEANYQGREQFAKLLKNAGDFSNDRIGLYLLFAAEGEGVTVLSENYEAEPLRAMFAAGQVSAGGESLFTPVVYPNWQDVPVEGARWIQLSAESAASLIADAGDVPCMLSKAVVDELRGTLGYRGIIMTGNLSDGVVTAEYSAGEAAVLAVQAGADIIYYPADFKEAYDAVLAAVNAGEISIETIDRAVGHILTEKSVIPAPAGQEETADNDAGDAGNVVANRGANTRNTADAQPIGGIPPAANQNSGGGNPNPPQEQAPQEQPVQTQPPQEQEPVNGGNTGDGDNSGTSGNPDNGANQGNSQTPGDAGDGGNTGNAENGQTPDAGDGGEGA